MGKKTMIKHRVSNRGRPFRTCKRSTRRPRIAACKVGWHFWLVPMVGVPLTGLHRFPPETHRLQSLTTAAGSDLTIKGLQRIFRKTTKDPLVCMVFSNSRVLWNRVIHIRFPHIRFPVAAISLNLMFEDTSARECIIQPHLPCGPPMVTPFWEPTTNQIYILHLNPVFHGFSRNPCENLDRNPYEIWDRYGGFQSMRSTPNRPSHGWPFQYWNPWWFGDPPWLFRNPHHERHSPAGGG